MFWAASSAPFSQVSRIRPAHLFFSALLSSLLRCLSMVLSVFPPALAGRQLITSSTAGDEVRSLVPSLSCRSLRGVLAGMVRAYATAKPQQARQASGLCSRLLGPSVTHRRIPVPGEGIAGRWEGKSRHHNPVSSSFFNIFIHISPHT